MSIPDDASMRTGDAELALPPGRWVGGLVKRYVTRPIVEPMVEPQRTLGYICDECGCLLLPGEDCPGCLVFALETREREAA